MRLLLVEDNRDILANLADYLTLKGHEVDCAQDGLTGLHLAATHPYDLIVLDVMLPGMDGYSLCQRLRESERITTPVIMLTARDALDDRLQGFRTGADDYLTKPFALSELAARIDAIVRRSRGTGRRELVVADLHYDLDTLEVRRGGQPVRIGPIGLKLLAVLMQKSPAVVRREELESSLWGEHPPDSDSLRSHVHSLRQIVDKPFPIKLLQTVHGIGYRLAPSDDVESPQS
jgi:DNA-binding response OmpR family regulator